MAIKKVMMVSALLLSFMGANAQMTEEQVKERKAVKEYTKAQLNEKASKTAKDEAKKLQKQGWITTPGAIPIEKQLDRAYSLFYEIDSEGFPRYIMAEAMSVGGNYDAAKMQAMELAKLNLAGQIQTEVTALIENQVANEQLAPEAAESITRTLSASKNLISQSIGRTIPVVEMYRVLPNKNKEVMVRIAYNSDMAKQAAKCALRDELNKQEEKVQEQLDQAMGW